MKYGRIAWIFPLLLLWGCLVKDKGAKTSATWTPPWDSVQKAPRALTGFPPSASDSLFLIFPMMEKTDSLVAASAERVLPTEPVDTLRMNHLFDSGFVFPSKTEASIPYAYDDYYRDDTLFRKYFGFGLYEQEHPCVQTYVLSGSFQHPSHWLKSGLHVEEIISSLGTPTMRHPLQLRYLWQAGPAKTTKSDTLDRFESIRLYFEADSLYAALLQRSKPCY